jgi:hypothetical protein
VSSANNPLPSIVETLFSSQLTQQRVEQRSPQVFSGAGLASHQLLPPAPHPSRENSTSSGLTGEDLLRHPRRRSVPQGAVECEISKNRSGSTSLIVSPARRSSPSDCAGSLSQQPARRWSSLMSLCERANHWRSVLSTPWCAPLLHFTSLPHSPLPFRSSVKDEPSQSPPLLPPLRTAQGLWAVHLVPRQHATCALDRTPAEAEASLGSGLMWMR